MSKTENARKTKIVCTIGPSTSSPEMLTQLIRSGMNVARLNFSHGDHESHLKTIKDIRTAAEALGQHVGILQDLAGPKIRLGRIEPRELKPGEKVILVSGESDAAGRLPVNYPHLYEDVEIGQRILLADGTVELLVVDENDGEITAEIVVGGIITSHKGVNLPTSDLRIPAFTDKDKADLELGLRAGVDFVAMSFVRHEKDLQPIKEMMRGIHRPPLLIAKIEKPQAVNRLDEIISVVQGIMVARGDLGVEMPVEEVPVIQKRIIREARRAGRVVITATQMLRSMVSSPRPTRAEVTDVANAILDGTDAVMLSEESAMGQYPIEAVKVLDSVCRYTEPQIDVQKYLKEEPSPVLPEAEAGITRAATWLARDLRPAAIVATTASGFTARLMSRYRPPEPIVALSPEVRTARQLCLSWGVIPALIPKCSYVDEVARLIKKWAAENGVAGPNDNLIITAGTPLAVEGTTNLIKVIRMDAPDEDDDQANCGDDDLKAIK